MRVVDLIERKRLGQRLTTNEIRFLIDGYVNHEVPDYQMSALLMAICFQGLDDEEVSDLTLAMAQSGEQLEWADIPGVKVDKHSTGGVGDTTSLVLAPLVAAAGVPVVKMSGRGLGHTGGTIDKLESIPGFRATLEPDVFKAQVQSIGVAIAGQTANLAPADKRMYALRDVTATVASIPLIASSIMSKKLASGADAIVLDVKVGDGAFMKTEEEAKALAKTMVRIGQAAHRQVVAVLTRMDEPLGFAIGNALEVREAIETLQGRGPRDLTELCLTIASHMLVLAGKAADPESARTMLEHLIASGVALEKFRAFVSQQGGLGDVVDDTSLLRQAPIIRGWAAPKGGIIQSMKAEALGLVAMRLGAGRKTYDDVIQPAVGLVLHKKVGEAVMAGEILATVHANSEQDAQLALAELADSILIGNGETFVAPLILGIIDEEAIGSASERESPAVLVQEALAALKLSYSPYSGFAVGAAIRLTNGQVVHGSNVENASYGLTSCAERNAVFHAIAAGNLTDGRRMEAIAVVADSPEPVAPCGACRQVLAEFCTKDTPVYLANVRGDIRTTTVGALLPYAFSSVQMGDA